MVEVYLAAGNTVQPVCLCRHSQAHGNQTRIIFIIICSLFNDDLSSSLYIASNDRMIVDNELKMM